MKHFYPYLLIFMIFLTNCENFGQLKIKAQLPKLFEEVSGIHYDLKENAFWMLNDSGNSPSVFLVSQQGKILRELRIDAKNHDWEDITMDADGNLYLGDFGNNQNKRKNLQILKIKSKDLRSKEKVLVENTYFKFPEQKKFPPKKKYFDAEGFFEWNGSFYLFTKSRVKNKIGRTFLYRIPNRKSQKSKGKKDVLEAIRISEFTTCPEKHCWITGADISEDGKKVAILNHKSVWIFTKFKEDDFFSGDAQQIPFGHVSQKESITIKNDSTLYIADEEEKGSRGRNLYSFRVVEK